VKPVLDGHRAQRKDAILGIVKDLVQNDLAARLGSAIIRSGTRS
jgi:hypothetical protein